MYSVVFLISVSYNIFILPTFTADYLHKLCTFPAKLQTEAVIMTRKFGPVNLKKYCETNRIYE